MKYCTHCGSEIADEAVICVHCGCAVNERKSADKERNNTLGKVALIFMIVMGCILRTLGGLVEGLVAMSGDAEVMATAIGTIIGSFIPLIWSIPMTISFKRKLRDGEYVSTAFKVCTLLFVSLVAGILMLCMSNDDNR